MRNPIIIGLLSLALIFSACSEYQKVLKSTDMQYKYDKALEYFKAEKYIKAYPIFEELHIAYRGSEKGERIAYLLAQCEYGLEDYILAGYRFGQFHKDYPSSVHAEESQFLAAYCNYKMSPRWSLDQTDTYKAIRSFQLFALSYPESSKMDSVNTLLDELRYKIEFKEYKSAKLYYRMERYKAASLAFENFNKRYPNSDYREETFYLSFRSAYMLALNSVDDKKADRIENAMKAYRTFADRFPDSSLLRDAQALHEELTQTKEDTKKPS